jgi:hypothetical protein
MIRVIVFALIVAGVAAMSVPVLATDLSPVCGDNSVDIELRRAAGCQDTEGVESIVGNIINAIIYIIAIVAVVMIVFAGQRYSVSQGDPGKVKQAKDMILYSVIGLVVAILAYALVNFILAGVL